jgi:hypothetical protein
MSSSHQQVRYEIDAGSIWVRVSSRASAARYWKVRTNGATKLWKRDAWRYRIPVKAGLKVYSEITNETVIGHCDGNELFICSFSDPNTIKRRA